MKAERLGRLVVTLPIVLIGVGLVGFAFTPKAKATQKKIVMRKGVRMTGDCEDFSPVDMQTWENFKATVKALGMQAPDAEAALLQMFKGLFPECPWPPRPTTTFDGTKSWQQVVDELAQYLGG